MKHWRIYAIIAVFACLTIAGFNGAFKKKRPDYHDRLWNHAQSIDTKEAWDFYIFLRDNAHHTNANIVSNRFFSLKPEMPTTNHTGTFKVGTVYYTAPTDSAVLRSDWWGEGALLIGGGSWLTNIVISNDWQGTIQVGTNYWEAQKMFRWIEAVDRGYEIDENSGRLRSKRMRILSPP